MPPEGLKFHEILRILTGPQFSSIQPKRFLKFKKRKPDYEGVKITKKEKKSIVKRSQEPLPKENFTKQIGLSISVAQGQMGIIDDSDEETYIESRGFGPCIGVVLYNDKAKSAGIAHIDGDTSIEETLQWLLEKVKLPCQASIIGGNSDKKITKSVILPQLVLIKRALEKSNVPIKDWDVMNTPIEKGRHIIVNKLTGKIYNLHPGTRTKKKGRDIKEMSTIDFEMVQRTFEGGGRAIPINHRD